jgi:hypothetical protein
MSTLAHVISKLGKVKPETKSIAIELFNAAKAAGHEIWFMWGIGTSAEHKTGLALDLMVHNEAAGDWLRNYIWKNRKRLRLRHVIWEQHITSTVNYPGKRRKMEDRGNPTANHYDHNHAWFFPGKYVAPPKTTKPVLDDGKPLIEDGKLGVKTIARWQKIMKTPVDGKIDEVSQLVFAVQKKLRATVDHRLVLDGRGIAQDGRPYKTVGRIQSYLKVPVDQILSTPVSVTVKALQRRLNEGRF